MTCLSCMWTSGGSSTGVGGKARHWPTSSTHHRTGWLSTRQPDDWDLTRGEHYEAVDRDPPWSASSPDEEGSEVECSLVSDGEFVGSHGQAAPLLKTGDASFDSVPLLAGLTVEAGWAAPCPASPEAVTNLVGGLRDDCANTAPTEVTADRAGGVGAISKNDGWPSSRPPEPGPRNPDSGHYRLKGRRVTSLACGDMDGHKPRLAVIGQTESSGVGQRGITVDHEGLLGSVQMSQSTPNPEALTHFQEPDTRVTNVPGQHS